MMSIGADLQHLLFRYPFGVDLEIPLGAAERWRSGGEPYLASAFGSAPGVTQPFLYPPWVLPPLSLLVNLPRGLVLGAWSLICIVSLLFVCHRLALPRWVWPVVALWPPALEPLIGGNVQLPIMALFCAVFWRAEAGSHSHLKPAERALDNSQTRKSIGVFASLAAAIKVSQPHIWIALLRLNPRSALFGAGAVVAVVSLSLVLTGPDLWTKWLEQLVRATDLTWELGGIAVGRLVHPVLGLLLATASAAAVLVLLPRVHVGAWVGVLTVVGAPSLHLFGTLFLIPAMLIIRRDLALLAGLLIATTTYEGTWAGILIVAGSMLLHSGSPDLDGTEGVQQQGAASARSEWVHERR